MEQNVNELKEVNILNDFYWNTTVSAQKVDKVYEKLVDGKPLRTSDDVIEANFKIKQRRK